MRPQYLKDVISLSAGEASQQALKALTKLCNFLLSGQPLQKFVIYYMVRLYMPFIIAIGNYLRRLISKLAYFQSRNIVNSCLYPHQLGVATKLCRMRNNNSYHMNLGFEMQRIRILVTCNTFS
jgi:hypothetical protein